MKTLFVFCLSFFLLVPLASCQQSILASGSSSPLLPKDRPLFFPHNWVRGYVDFALAPPHNEPDLGRCSFPQPSSSGGATSQCSAYARYLFSGYVEIHPIAQTFARQIFLFIEPKFSFGSNVPQLSYSYSLQPIAFDRSVGIGITLPRNFELRATQHQVDFLGKYSRNVGSGDLRTNGPYGLYATVGVRWSFGGYGRSQSSEPH